MKTGEQHVLDTIASWNESGVQDDGQIEQWTAQGLAFALSPQGTQAMHDVESKKIADMQHKMQKFGSPVKYAAQMYIKTEHDDAETFVLLSKKTAILEELRASSVAEGDTSEGDGMEKLIGQGKVFTNVSKIFIDEQMLNRIDYISTRMHNEFPIDSPEWKRWTAKTSVYNATSLTQVMAEYYQENSIGDVGGAQADYIPKRGYPGTLAPGEKFTDNYALEDLPHHILHPWPSMQQIQFHVRWAPNHPMLPPPLLWFGLNNMYTENFTDWQIQASTDTDEIVGGAAMDPKDAILIARNGCLGMSYDPAEQIPHGGMLFPGGHQIPFYHPDHGPTVPMDVAKAPIPVHLLPITERWLDPLYGLDIPVIKTAVGETEVEDDLLEEESRKAAADRLLSFAPQYSMPPPTEWEEGKKRIEDEFTEIIIMRKDALKEVEDWSIDRSEREQMSPEALEAAMSVPSVERELAKQITDSIYGQ